MAKPDKEARKAQASRKRAVHRLKSTAIWVVVIAGIGGLLYGLSTSSSIAFDETDLAVINFSELNEDQKETALEAANGARCTCGCGMALAQCVATDMTCPVRAPNIQRIEKMVADAKRTAS